MGRLAGWLAGRQAGWQVGPGRCVALVMQVATCRKQGLLVHTDRCWISDFHVLKKSCTGWSHLQQPTLRGSMTMNEANSNELGRCLGEARPARCPGCSLDLGISVSHLPWTTAGLTNLPSHKSSVAFLKLPPPRYAWSKWRMERCLFSRLRYIGG